MSQGTSTTVDVRPTDFAAKDDEYTVRRVSYHDRELRRMLERLLQDEAIMEVPPYPRAFLYDNDAIACHLNDIRLKPYYNEVSTKVEFRCVDPDVDDWRTRYLSEFPIEFDENDLADLMLSVEINLYKLRSTAHHATQQAAARRGESLEEPTTDNCSTERDESQSSTNTSETTNSTETTLVRRSYVPEHPSRMNIEKNKLILLTKNEGKKNSYNPLKYYFASLQKPSCSPEESRRIVEGFLGHFFNITPFSESDHLDEGLYRRNNEWASFGMLGGIYLRTLYPGAKYDWMNILWGPERMGKSTILSKLLPDWISEHAYTDNVDFTRNGFDPHRRILENTKGKSVVEIAEMSGVNSGLCLLYTSPSPRD